MYNSIRPGKEWKDTNGNRIQAHGFTVFYNEKESLYYWYGENKEHTDGRGTIWHWGVRLYTSPDLYNWTDKGLIIPPHEKDLKSPLHPTYCVDRPHIIYCANTKKYVAWLKIMADEVSQFFSVMTADRFEGPYTFAFNIDQKGIVKRLMITIPLFMAVIGFMLIDFNILWRYFAWCNQALSVFTLWAVTVYLARHRRFYFITLIPAMFMTMVCGTYLLSAAHPEGFGLDMNIALAISTLVTASFLVRFSFYLRKIRSIEPSLN